MKFLFILIITNTLAYGACDQIYSEEINKLNDGLKSIGNTPAAVQVKKRRDSLETVRRLLIDISKNNLNGAATLAFSREARVNPRTLQNLVNRSNKRDQLCSKGILLGADEIADLIRNGKMF